MFLLYNHFSLVLVVSIGLVILFASKCLAERTYSSVPDTDLMAHQLLMFLGYEEEASALRLKLVMIL